MSSPQPPSESSDARPRRAWPVVGILLLLAGGVVVPPLFCKRSEYVACGHRDYVFRGRVVAASNLKPITDAEVVLGVGGPFEATPFPLLPGGELLIENGERKSFGGTAPDGSFAFRWEQRFCRAGEVTLCGGDRTTRPARPLVDEFVLTATADGFFPKSVRTKRPETRNAKGEYELADIRIELDALPIPTRPQEQDTGVRGRRRVPSGSD